MTTVKKDEETGEPLTTLNSETGEEEFIITSCPTQTKSKNFKIPPSQIKPKKNEDKIKLDCSPTFTTAILFLLPTSIFFYPILGIFTVAIEVVIHIWAHRKNKLLRNKNHYYQSPLHIICKEFCGACKEEASKMQISKIHGKRADKMKKYGLEYVRRIVT